VLGEWVAARATGGAIPGRHDYTRKAHPGIWMVAQRGAGRPLTRPNPDTFTLTDLATLLRPAPGGAAPKLPVLAEVWAKAGKEW
jgi:hypothetical protein